MYVLFVSRHIRRIIFYSLIKPTLNKKGEKEMDTISVSAALQIAGRAGRYGTQWDKVKLFFILSIINKNNSKTNHNFTTGIRYYFQVRRLTHIEVFAESNTRNYTPSWLASYCRSNRIVCISSTKSTVVKFNGNYYLENILKDVILKKSRKQV